MRKLKGVLIILLLSIGLSSADYVTDLEDTLFKQEKKIDKQEDIITDQKIKIVKLEAEDGTDRIFLNLTKDKVKGGVVTLGVIYIHPVLGILYFF